ncbi:hypothetical protein llap_20531 [Limosa lapponica baueri]|uniref:Uncharacterized protein n=1 Tax=Limosa lapponica baueri TaxID=1758121 RepID=A0A2I0T5U5_LIMLA|nr:hypothetical protein llap_20531 [Limosa lapponica baueri]
MDLRQGPQKEKILLLNVGKIRLLWTDGQIGWWHSEGGGQSQEVQRGQVQSPACGWEQPRLGDEVMESNHDEKNWGNEKLVVKQWTTVGWRWRPAPAWTRAPSQAHGQIHEMLDLLQKDPLLDLV